ncbi:HRDC domain-containing protein [Leucobacter ruminantium]|uniref:HRDC domain-containing protein n=1 Tax=Leucobacter ruminantium TaxID=1289170 RepID=A0A939RZ37_9MICO|nr:HRDC domain-containing protein [Leucobacter ruminantium]MBO1806333.1 HRDC domain-containing protein [Leucobacter ruminantium]
MITDDAGVRRAAELLAAGEGPVGIDAERASGFRYGSEAYLVQAYRRGGEALLFDPVGITDFSPLADALAGEEWILHAASQDLPCLDEIGLRPERIFDTELAARLLGFERVGLGAIVEALLGIRLEKAHSAADWSQRPLPEPWLEYAALDVALLPDLRDAVHAELEAQQKLEIAEQEFAAVRDRLPKPPIAEPWRKLAGNRIRSPRQLAMLRELWTARDELARERDVAPGRLIPDASVIAAVAANPRSAGELARLQTFKGRASRSELNRWWKAILRGKTTEDLPGPQRRDPDAIPHHRGWAQRHPEAAERLAAARAVVEAEAERRRMPVENLLTPDHLRRLAWQPPQPPTTDAIALRLRESGAREWQIALTAPILAPVFVDHS